MRRLFAENRRRSALQDGLSAIAVKKHPAVVAGHIGRCKIVPGIFVGDHGPFGLGFKDVVES